MGHVSAVDNTDDNPMIKPRRELLNRSGEQLQSY